jgi:tetratricopeptide (TPR) repeat protein
LPDYRRLLLERLLRLDPDGTELARKSPAALFEWLLVEPLRYGIDGGRRDDRYLIVIDALDETIRDGRSELAEVLAEAIMKLPVWIAMVVTSRPEPLILRQFAGFQRQQIDAQSAENLDDLRSFAHEWLGGLAHKPGEVDLLVEAVVAASSGNFLYLRKLREAVAVGVVELASLQALPQGLVGLYERWFRRQFPDEVAYEAIVPLLEVLVAAQQPVPEAWLARLFRWPKRKRSRALEALGSLFEWRAEGIAAFHKSLRDWLVDDHVAGPDFVIDASRGTTRLVRGLWEEFLGWAKAKNRSSLDLFCIRELPSQVMLASAEEVRALPVSREAWPELWGALVLAADQLTTAFNWEAALSWWRMVVTLSEVPGDIARAQRSLAYRSAGDVLRTLGRRLEAGDDYRTALQIAQALVAEDAENFEWRRALFSAQIRIGNIHAVAGGSADALAAYREANNLIRALAGQHRGDSELQRDLFVSLERLGDALWTQGDNAGALAAYQEGSCSGIAPETRQ